MTFKCTSILISLCALTYSGNVVFSQVSNSPKPNYSSLSNEKILEQALVLTMDGQLYEANQLMDVLLEKEPNNSYYNYLKGFNTLYSEKDHAKAIEYFEKTIRPATKKLELLSPESSVTNDVYFHTGSAYHFLGNIDSAEHYYTQFSELSTKTSILRDQVAVRLEQCKVARKLINSPSDADVVLIEGPINSKLAEYSPVISANGRELYFTSRRDWDNVDLSENTFPIDNSYPEDVYMSKLENNSSWSLPKILPLCDPYRNEASISLSPNMSKLFVYSDKEGNGNLFTSDYQLDHFKSIEEIDYEKVNSKSWEPHYSCSSDSTLLIFSSDRRGGEGGRDLWYMILGNDGNWSKPINMGPSINTSEDEDAPFLTLDDEYMYYASSGPQSMGGFDIFRTKINAKGETQNPENLGVPINSTGDDLFFSITHDGQDGYFSSFRKTGIGENDIYHLNNSRFNKPANVIALTGRVINLTEDVPPVDLIVTLYNHKTKQEQQLNVKDASYFELLDDCTEYTIKMSNSEDNTLLSEETIQTNCENQPKTIEHNYYNGHYWIDGVVTDAETKALIGSPVVKLINKETGAEIPSSVLGEGKFTSDPLKELLPEQDLTIIAQIRADGYVDKEIELTETLGSKGQISMNMELEKLSTAITSVEDKVKEFIIYFDYDKSNIRLSEEPILEEVIELMNANPELELMLYSHTDARGSLSYNQRLSRARAKSSMMHIQKNISNPGRIKAKGMGETMLAVDCEECSEDQHQKNRRTTFEIISK